MYILVQNNMAIIGLISQHHLKGDKETLVIVSYFTLPTTQAREIWLK